VCSRNTHHSMEVPHTTPRSRGGVQLRVDLHLAGEDHVVVFVL
jgi:hypothetical protein